MPKDCDTPGVSGFFMRVGDQFGICYATHIKNEGFMRFTEDPVAVIMSSGGQIEWCFVSEPLEANPKTRWIDKGSALPPRSMTARFNKVSSNITSGRTEGGYTSLDEWFDDGPQVEMKE